MHWTMAFLHWGRRIEKVCDGEALPSRTLQSLYISPEHDSKQDCRQPELLPFSLSHSCYYEASFSRISVGNFLTTIRNPMEKRIALKSHKTYDCKWKEKIKKVMNQKCEVFFFL